jgi:hypothetical protein
MDNPAQDLYFQSHMSWYFFRNNELRRKWLLICWYWWNCWLHIAPRYSWNHGPHQRNSRGLIQVLSKGKQFMLLIGNPLCYLYIQSIDWLIDWVYFCFVCLRPVYPMLPVSLDCPFLIAPSVFSNIYYRPVSCVPSVASFSGLSIFDCSFGFL